METITLTVSDETLRDGEQQVGLFLEPDTKYALAHRVVNAGIHQIALMPAVHETEEQLVQQLVAEGLESQVIASTLMGRSFIEQSKACGVRQIILFHAVSDRLLFLRDAPTANDPAYRDKTLDDAIATAVMPAIRQRMVEKVLDHLRYATDLGLRVYFAAEDASRADFAFLVDCIDAFAPYIDQVLLCDTVGALTPEKTFIWVHDLLEYADSVPLAVHFHNDMGMALENTIQAVLAGATGISGTLGGIGERAGNAPLEQVLNGLRMRFGWEVEGIDYDALAIATESLHQMGLRPHPPYSQQAQCHESGIHVSSMLRDRQSYSILPYGTPEIWFGKCSGASNFQYLFEHHLQRPLTPEQYERLRVAIKALSIQKRRSFSMEDILDLLNQGILRL